LKSEGVRIALDDVGEGQATYRMTVDYPFDYLKIDRYLVQGCGRDARRLAVLESLAELAGKIGSRVIAEGIETGEDLAAVRSAGIDLAQGYLLGRPQLGPELMANFGSVVSE